MTKTTMLAPPTQSPRPGICRLKGDRTGAALVAALQASPYREIDVEPKRERLPVRRVKALTGRHLPGGHYPYS